MSSPEYGYTDAITQAGSRAWYMYHVKAQWQPSITLTHDDIDAEEMIEWVLDSPERVPVNRPVIVIKLPPEVLSHMLGEYDLVNIAFECSKEPSEPGAQMCASLEFWDSINERYLQENELFDDMDVVVQEL